MIVSGQVYDPSMQDVLRNLFPVGESHYQFNPDKMGQINLLINIHRATFRQMYDYTQETGNEAYWGIGYRRGVYYNRVLRGHPLHVSHYGGDLQGTFFGIHTHPAGTPLHAKAFRDISMELGVQPRDPEWYYGPSLGDWWSVLNTESGLNGVITPSGRLILYGVLNDGEFRYFFVPAVTDTPGCIYSSDIHECLDKLDDHTRVAILYALSDLKRGELSIFPREYNVLQWSAEGASLPDGWELDDDELAKFLKMEEEGR